MPKVVEFRLFYFKTERSDSLNISIPCFIFLSSAFPLPNSIRTDLKDVD